MTPDGALRAGREWIQPVMPYLRAARVHPGGTPSSDHSPRQPRDFLIRRFSLMDRPGFLVTGCRGDLMDMTLPDGLLRRRWWPGLVVVTAAPGRRCAPANAGHRGRAVHGERAEAALPVEQANADDRREDHQAE